MRRGEDAEAGAVDLVQFLSTWMNVNELRTVAWNVQQRVALRRHFGEPSAHQQHEVRLLDPLQKLRVGTDAKVAREIRMVRRKQHLAAEGYRDRKVESFGKAHEVLHPLLAPARSACEDHRPLG